jgi:hypothetical protein
MAASKAASDAAALRIRRHRHLGELEHAVSVHHQRRRSDDHVAIERKENLAALRDDLGFRVGKQAFVFGLDDEM